MLVLKRLYFIILGGFDNPVYSASLNKKKGKVFIHSVYTMPFPPLPLFIHYFFFILLVSKTFLPFTTFCQSKLSHKLAHIYNFSSLIGYVHVYNLLLYKAHFLNAYFDSGFCFFTLERIKLFSHI